METTDLDSLLQLENSPDIDAIISQIRVRVQQNAPEKPVGAASPQAEQPAGPSAAAIEDALKAQATFNGELMQVLQQLGKEFVSLRAELAQVREQQQAAAEQDRKMEESLVNTRSMFTRVDQEQVQLKQQLAGLAQAERAERQDSERTSHALADQIVKMDERVRGIDLRLLVTGKQMDRVASRTHEVSQQVEQLDHQVNRALAASTDLKAHVAQVEKQSRRLEADFDRVARALERKWSEGLSNHEKVGREEFQSVRTAVDSTLKWTNAELDTIRSDFHSALEGVQRQISELESIRGLVQQDYVYLSDRTRTLERRATELAAMVSNAQARVDHRFDALTMRVLRAERGSLNRPALSAVPGLRAPLAKYNGNGSTGHPALAFDYFMFEHKYRGSVDSVRQRQAIYVNLFSGRRHVVDLGCGRGEFLDLMTKEGVSATGVDANCDMVDFCRERGLDVVQADLFDYLSSLPSADLDGIFVAQVIEHMSPDQIQKLIELCEKKLAPDGLFVLETVNPLCQRALSNFWLDPTHVRPVPPHLLTFMLQQANFRIANVRFASPIDTRATAKCFETVENLEGADSYQDYAVIASRRCSNSMRGNG